MSATNAGVVLNAGTGMPFRTALFNTLRQLRVPFLIARLKNLFSSRIVTFGFLSKPRLISARKTQRMLEPGPFHLAALGQLWVDKVPARWLLGNSCSLSTCRWNGERAP